MSDLFNPNKKFTQSDIAKLLGISDRQVRTLVQKGILPASKPRSGYDPLVCVQAYIRYKTKTKASTTGQEVDGQNDEEFNEDEMFERQERRLKLEERQEKLLMMKAKRVLFEKTYAPIEIIVDTLQQVGSTLESRHDSLLPKMKIAYPDMPPEMYEVLEAELAATANECTTILPDLSDYINEDPGSSPSWLIGDEEGSANFGNEVVR
jgi:phage terminase Nu1 subunit (DNA packaging protein)